MDATVVGVEVHADGHEDRDEYLSNEFVRLPKPTEVDLFNFVVELLRGLIFLSRFCWQDNISEVTKLLTGF
jgi:hypothetical protein